MTCQNCARKVREAAAQVPGVVSAVVDLDAGRLRIGWEASGGEEPSAAVEASVRRAGFGATREEETKDARSGAGAGAGAADGGAVSRPGSGWRFNVFFGGWITLVLMVGEWGLGWGHWVGWGWVGLILATPVQFWCGARFYRGAWNQLRRGSANMDTLVSLGSTAAYVFSVWRVVSGEGGHVYFMEASAIITLISVGHWLEAVATDRATGAIRALMALVPPTARRRRGDGSEELVSLADLVVGDRIHLQPGDRVPTDAVVEEGTSAVDEAMVTGESVPVEKGPGSVLLGGTANQSGRLVARVQATGEGTVLAQIMAAVERAQHSRAGIQRLVDRISAIFVPVVVLLALATAAWWGWAPESARAWHDLFAGWLWRMSLPADPWAAAVIHATSVLIVACPCAMGLATPVAILAGTNAAALRGILVRDGVALEKAGVIDTVVFDKTGTLTMGRLEVVAERDLRRWGEDDEALVVRAARLAQGSSHPVARALVKQAALGGLAGSVPAEKGGGGTWREVRGCGLEWTRSGQVERLGALAWLHECGVEDMPAEKGGALARGQPVSLVGLAEGKRLLGWFELRDVLRSESESVVADLHRDGFDVYLLTGDAWLAAEAVGREAGIAAGHVLAGVRPEDKAGLLERLQGEGRRVAFVGDGLNDGPALARADLGIAVSQATDVAREAADLVLLQGGLGRIRPALGLAQATLTTIRQNLFWAFFYNALAVPLAMLGFFSPVVCAAAMGLSDLLVVGNALRLRYRDPAGMVPRVPRRKGGVDRRPPETGIGMGGEWKG